MTIDEPRPHRAHHSKLTAVAALAVFAAGCGGGLPRPRPAPILVEEYVAVPFPPRPPPVEIVPPKPEHDPKRPNERGRIVWADGGWELSNGRYQWEAGAWVALPEGARRSRWALVRRAADGQLFFAPSRWRDASGRTIPAPTPLARAVRERAGGDVE